MIDLLEKFTSFIKAQQLIQKNDHILVAVSGGVDSVVLLDLLVQLSKSMQLKIQLIHLNHGIRDGQAERDQEFVAQLAEKYGLPLISEKVSVPHFITDKKMSEEEGARLLRYRFFDQVLKQTGADSIALGHHADDQVETVVDHFLRGSGVKGLVGMPVRREHFIRPLLFATRKEIETYANDHSLDYIIDSTNEMLKYRRNRIRHELIPYLRQHFNEGIDNVVLRTSQIMAEVETYLTHQAQIAFEYCLVNLKKNKIILDINAFLSYFIIIQKYILYRALERLQLERSTLTADKLDRVLALATQKITGRKIYLTSNWQVLVDHNYLVIYRGDVADYQVDVRVNKSYELLDGELEFNSELITGQQLQFSRNRNEELVDYEKITGNLVIRNFRKGDRFRPLNFTGEKKLSDFFTDLKVPLHQRRSIPLLVCDTGIVWVAGYQIDDRFKVTKETNKILRLQVREKKTE